MLTVLGKPGRASAPAIPTTPRSGAALMELYVASAAQRSCAASAAFAAVSQNLDSNSRIWAYGQLHSHVCDLAARLLHTPCPLERMS